MFNILKFLKHKGLTMHDCKPTPIKIQPFELTIFPINHITKCSMTNLTKEFHVLQLTENCSNYYLATAVWDLLTVN